MDCESYLLDNQALALLAYEDEEGNQSVIVTLHGPYLSKLTPIRLLNAACLQAGATKKIRKQEAQSILQCKHKPPFLIADGVGVFPTSSSNHKTCVWIFNHFFTMSSTDNQTTTLTFATGITVTVPVSQHVLRQQNGRLHTLLSHYAQTKREMVYEEMLFHSKRYS